MNQGLLGPCGEGLQHGLVNPESSHPALLWMAAVGGGGTFLQGYVFEFWGGSLRAVERGACSQSKGGSLRFEQHPKAPLTLLCQRSPSLTRSPGCGVERRVGPVSGGDASWEETLPECAPTPTHENLTPGYHRIPTAPAHSRCPINKRPKLLAAWTVTLTGLLVLPGACSRISSSGIQGLTTWSWTHSQM